MPMLHRHQTRFDFGMVAVVAACDRRRLPGQPSGAGAGWSQFAGVAGGLMNNGNVSLGAAPGGLATAASGSGSGERGGQAWHDTPWRL
jgi:hypothetical protein